ncbi:hypothetical protein ACWGI9_32055 [Streptomyces sp. NPDC054833]
MRSTGAFANSWSEEDGLRFAIPPGFTPLPIDSLLARPDSPEAEQLNRAVASILASAPDEATCEQVAVNLAVAQRMIRALRVSGTVHCSLGLHRDDSGHGDADVLFSLFTITWVGTSWAPRAVIAARALATSQGHTHMSYAELACGPAAFSEALRTPIPESGLPAVPLLQFYSHLPHPDGTGLALLTLSTTATLHRDSYRMLLRRISELVTFEEPSTRTADNARSG